MLRDLSMAMKIKTWALLRLAVIAAYAVVVVLHRPDSETDAHIMGLGVAFGIAFLAVFQLLVWILTTF